MLTAQLIIIIHFKYFIRMKSKHVILHKERTESGTLFLFLMLSTTNHFFVFSVVL